MLLTYKNAGLRNHSIDWRGSLMDLVPETAQIRPLKFKAKPTFTEISLD